MVLGSVRRPRPLERRFERSRLHPQLIARAYELVVPITRRALPVADAAAAALAARNGFAQRLVGG
jgi:hypothetical protein